MKKQNAFYAQSGGVTAVINASACGVIETARANRGQIGKVYAGYNGITGALNENLLDTSKESARTIAALRHSPGAAFGSCRYKLKSLEESKREYLRLIEVFKAHNIGYFFYNGGGDSADTCLKVAQITEQLGYPLRAIHIPKTVDNDLPITDNCPGFGSVAKYVAVSTREAAMDVASMCATSTCIFILEVMGRHAGWIAGASALAGDEAGDAPHIILFPEIAFDRKRFLERVKQSVDKYGYCVVVASEGVQDHQGRYLSEAGIKDVFGHTQLGGVAPILAHMIKDELGYRYHWSVADYLQRSARHIASAVDAEQAYALGKAAVEMAIAGNNAVMPAIVRGNTKKYRWKIESAPLDKVANVEKKMPRSFISRDGFGITASARAYFAPLIEGEDYPPYKDGIPQYAKLKRVFVEKKLPEENF